MRTAEATGAVEVACELPAAKITNDILCSPSQDRGAR